jgi:hypothetical protein
MVGVCGRLPSQVSKLRPDRKTIDRSVIRGRSGVEEPARASLIARSAFYGECRMTQDLSELHAPTGALVSLPADEQDWRQYCLRDPGDSCAT